MEKALEWSYLTREIDSGLIRKKYTLILLFSFVYL